MTRAALLAFILLCAPALAQPDGLLQELSRHEQRAADASLPAADRDQAADKAIEVRRAAIDAARPADPWLAPLLVEQAAALLTRLARDGSDTAALFGVPPQSTRARVQDAAVGALALLRRVPESDETLRPRLLLLRGRAEALLAALDNAFGHPSDHSAPAIAALESLKLDDPAADAFRRVTLAAIYAVRGVDDDDKIAAGLLRGLTTADVPVATRVEAQLALCHVLPEGPAILRAAMKREPFRTSAGPDPLRTLHAIGAISHTYHRRWRNDTLPETLAAAYAPLRDLLLGRIETGLPDDTRQAVALSALIALTEAAVPLGALDAPEVQLAYALISARKTGERAHAIRAFRDAADHPDAGGIRPIALWELGVLLSRGDDPAEAARILTAYAREYPGTDRAAQAIDAALAAARTAARSGREGAPLLLDALTVALARTPPHPRAADLRLERAALRADDPSKLFAFLDDLSHTPAAVPQATAALAIFDRTADERIETARAAVAAARAAQDEHEVRRLAEAALPDARRLAAYADEHGSALSDRLLATLAELLIESGYPAQADPIVRDLLKRRAEVPGGRPRLQLALSRSLQPTDAPAAFAVLRELVAPFDADPAAPRPDEYWHAWTLMLETAAADHPEAAKAADLRAQLARLTALDPTLGGEPWKTRLRRVAEPKP